MPRTSPAPRRRTGPSRPRRPRPGPARTAAHRWPGRASPRRSGSVRPSESLGENRCAFEPGSDYPEMLALYLGMLDADFTIVDSPELADALRTLIGRYQRAIDASAYLSRTTVVRALAAAGGTLTGGKAHSGVAGHHPPGADARPADDPADDHRDHRPGRHRREAEGSLPAEQNVAGARAAAVLRRPGFRADSASDSEGSVAVTTVPPVGSSRTRTSPPATPGPPGGRTRRSRRGPGAG